MEGRRFGAITNKRGRDLLDIIFSWSLDDIFDNDHYQVKKIEDRFESVKHYASSFYFPLLEETRADISSKMESITSSPYAEVISLEESKRGRSFVMYDAKIIRRSSSSESAYRNGDIVLLTDAKPETITDFQCFKYRPYTFGCISKISRGDETSQILQLKVPIDLQVKEGFEKLLHVISVTNITTNQRMWHCLNSVCAENQVIKEVLYTPTSTAEKDCNLCSFETNSEDLRLLASYLDESQLEAVSAMISKMKCNHKSFVELIWGPPGTGKTRTVSALLWSLLRLDFRILACSPTNVAINELASRVLKLVKESSDEGLYSVGDILLFGNIEGTTVDIKDIFLDHRISRLVECFGDLGGWNRSFKIMIELLKNGLAEYHRTMKSKSFLEFFREKYKVTAAQVKRCMSTLCTHVPRQFLKDHNFKNMLNLLERIDSFERKLFTADSLYGEELVNAFSNENEHTEKETGFWYFKYILLQEMIALQCSLNLLNFPNGSNRDLIEEFIFRRASLIFCTASGSYRLRMVEMQPIELLVIDEAAQLKESESIIPLNVSNIRHAILIGDEFQLPAVVKSKVCEEAGFGRSMFERLSILGHSKHMLNIQYRMHPSISFFPNKTFYKNQIADAPSVQSESYKRSYLAGSMFSSYSFINVSGGREVIDEGSSRKNLVEASVVLRIIHMLFKAHSTADSPKKLSVMVISPYTAQVVAIQRRLGQKYENNNSFTVKVTSIDGCQGGEEDIVILSTVRSNTGGAVGFTSNLNRTNVALTRARHCCWIIGNDQTLTNSGSIWEDIVFDAKVRQCFYDADEDKVLRKEIMDVKKELNHLEDLLSSDSTFFKHALWKVIFSDIFRKSFLRMKSTETKNLILLFLSKLSSGWRPKIRTTSVGSSKMLKQYYVAGFYLIVSVDLVKEHKYIQALKIWDVLLLHEIPKLVNILENVFEMYTEEYIGHCKQRRIEAEKEVPITWPGSAEIVQHKSIGTDKMKDSSDADGTASGKKVEKTYFRESLQLMKFYSLSSGVVNYLLSDCNGKQMALPFELTEQEKEIVNFNRSTFVLGRSGTGKTTVLTMKLFQNEQLFHIASKGFHEVENNPTYFQEDSNNDVKGNKDILRQIFLTVSPRLCHTVKAQILQMKRSVCGGSSSSQSNLISIDEIDDVALFADIPDSFVGIPSQRYPLVITFRKFLLMLDGSVGVSYFNGFSEINNLNQSGSVGLETFIRTKEVNFDKFCLSYWPHFNSHHKKNLDPSQVFTEIMSVIKGGLQRTDKLDTKLTHEEYILLAKNRESTLNEKLREAIYNIFVDYEREKRINCEFDLADLVIDIHRRLMMNRFVGDEMDFVYVDEVQDLSMRQIALFKYICKNVEEGFSFCGDTAQTIAKGIDFRFEDIRRLFFNEFLVGAKKESDNGKEKKGLVSRTFHLRQNFRTHDGILKLAQSIINLIYHFFPQSIDVLAPETTSIRGEAPVLLLTKENENVIKLMFDNVKNEFGAQQVILVRDECLRNEVCKYVGKKALVLTILDCKGLEFEDVLLYNFFSSSSFKKEWQVIYEFMKEKELLDSSFHVPFKRFNLEKHSGLCSELKQLYVAITRTKHRLWICEDEVSDPVVHYWIKLCLVEERELDKSFMKEILVESSHDDWKSRGIKLFHEKNYDSAIMCFERARDFYWTRLSEAYSLRAADYHNQFSDQRIMRENTMKAGEIFESIEKYELAAQCFFEINEYKRAGTIYIDHFGDSKLEKAGECFTLAGNLRNAAQAYARARLYKKCLSSCADGNLFLLGFQYWQSWKEDGILTEAQNFLERGALYYYEQNDKKNMMKFVTSFHSKESMRTILMNLKRLDDLIMLEREWGNFIEAANLANQKGDMLLEADLLEKAGYFKESSMLKLWFVFSNYLRQLRSNCRTLKPFPLKEKILEKAKMTAKNHSDTLFKFVCAEAETLSRAKTVHDVQVSGLQFVRNCCKLSETSGLERILKKNQLMVIEHELIEKCAHHHYSRRNSELMMKYVMQIKSLAQRRSFLKSLNCIDELITMEEEEGNLLEAAQIAERNGDLARKSSLLQKSGNFVESSELILFNVLTRSLWESGSTGWPLKQFTQKDELLTKAKSDAKHHSCIFYVSVCMEANALSNQQRSLINLKEYFRQFQRQKLLRGEIITSWKILDIHLNMEPATYAWNDIPINDITSMVSVEMLVNFWDRWMQKISELIKYLLDQGLHDVDAGKCEEFCLSFFGLRKNFDSEDAFYSLLNPNAFWAKNIHSRFVRSNGNLVCIESHHFFAVALEFWYAEVLRLGVSVLKKLIKLHAYSVENKHSLLQQSICALDVFRITKLIQHYSALCHKKDFWLMNSFEQSAEQFFCKVLHIEWQNWTSEDMNSFLKDV